MVRSPTDLGSGPTTPAAGRPEDLADVLARLRRELRRCARLVVPQESLSVAQAEVLQALAEHPGATAGAVAHRLRLAPATVSSLLTGLLGAHWVERRPDPHDRRSYALHVTAPGAAALRRWRAANSDALVAAVAELDGTDRAALTRAVPALERLLERLALR